MTKLFPVLIFIFLFSCVSKKENTVENDVEKPLIAVVNYPLYYFAKAIGGDHVTVYFPAIEGDPAYWKPNAKQVSNFQNADLILANGAGYAKWMEKVSLPSSKIVVTSISFEDQWIEVNEGLAHSHGAEGEHIHKGTAFTTWLNFKLAAKQSESIFKVLKELIPNHTEELNQNFEQLNAGLSELDKRMETIAKELGHQRLIASHPVYQYLEAGYGLEIINEHWESNEMPTTSQWKDLQKLINEHQARVMIWEDDPIEEIKSKLDEMNIKIAVFSPCANNPEAGDFMDLMNENLNQLERMIK
ncbi:MAG: zinc ABC transporter substrate-binding protein [Cyclobacteriaceae bacterium]|nr:zinc ABC transporter substrate-binding protein [Cyclobacteriaceae bacterium]